MTGLIYMKHGVYVFRNDTGFGKDYWAWNIYGDIGDHIPVSKWNKLPKANNSNHKKTYYPVVLFDIDNPPRTVSYLPILD